MWTIFPEIPRKIAGIKFYCSVGLRVLNVKMFSDTKGRCSCLEETCHRPPREETERLKRRGERERQPTVGNSLFFQHKHISAVITSKQPERERAWCLPGMDHDRVREYCLSHFIHSLNLMFDIWKMHMHINPCKQLKTAELWTCTL